MFLSTQYAFFGFSYMISWLYVNADSAYKTVFLLTFGVFVLIPLILMMLLIQLIEVYDAFYTFMLCLLALISPVMGML